MVTPLALPPGRQRGDRPLRVAMVAPPWYEVPPRGYGGVEAICGTLVDALVLRGHDVTLIGVGSARTSARFLRTYDTPQFARLGESLPELTHVGKANQLIADGGFDIVHDHTCAGALAAAQRNPPTIATVHGPVRGELGDFYASLGDSVRLVAISDSQRRLRPNLAWAGTVHNSLQVEQFPYQVHKQEYVLWLARFCEDKGPDLAIKACRAAGLPLILAGKCAEPLERLYLDEVVRPLLGPDVELVLNAERAHVLSLLVNARCLLLPLRWPEPFGMVMIEAMACGTPVVALGRGAVPEVVRDGETGLVCWHAKDLPAALNEVARISPAACRNHVCQSFSAQVMAERYEQVYRAALSDAAPNRRVVEFRGS
jgi:glycosyltransferase involved in cell wall biosynthesis